MKRITLAIVAVLVATGSTAFLAFAAAPGRGDSNAVWAAISKARLATAKYHDVRQALKDGYVPVSACVEAPDSHGAMGIHYLNKAYAADHAIRADKPELLLYFPTANGKLRLVESGTFYDGYKSSYPQLHATLSGHVPAVAVPPKSGTFYDGYKSSYPQLHATLSAHITPVPGRGFDWRDASVGAGTAAGVIVLLAVSALLFMRRRTRLAV
jgi:hypothetical protein